MDADGNIGEIPLTEDYATLFPVWKSTPYTKAKRNAVEYEYVIRSSLKLMESVKEATKCWKKR